MNPPPAIVTVFARNYLPRARVLAASLRRFHPELPLLALCVGPVRDVAPWEMLRPPIAVPRGATIKAAASAAKPLALELALDRGFASAVYLDPDILVRAPLTELFAIVARHAVTLTPHLLDPLAGDDRIVRELNILQSGTFNAGFIGVSRSADARAFLAWWRERVSDQCEHAVAEGVYYDQRWLDLAPVFFDDVRVWRDPEYNAAHWNVPERDLSRARFIHFSGFDPSRPDVVTRYSRRLTADAYGPLLQEYARLLREAE